MLSRVVAIADEAATAHPGTNVIVATEDERIAAHCREIGARCVMTSPDCATGSDRVLEAAQKSGSKHDILFSLQGDAPFTPVAAITAMINAFAQNPDYQVVTPAVRLRWVELDALRESKKTTPFSGTTVTIGPDGRALWFSKNIIPALRKEDRGTEFSPIYQHLGLYAYRTETLERFVSLPQSHYEKLEGLEQLRLLENNISVHTVTLAVDAGLAQAGIDSPEDLARAEKLLS